MSQSRIIALMLLVLGTTVTEADAQLLSERLTPPQQFTVPQLPMTEQPGQRRPAGADKVPAHLWALPVVSIPGAPTMLSSESLPVDWRRPVRDIPMLAAEYDPTRPASPRLPVAASSFALAADPQSAATLDRFPLPPALPLRVTDNPSSGAAHELLTRAVPLATPNAATLLRLSISDPFDYLRAIRLPQAPADSDAPTASRELPARPQLSALK